MTPVWRPASLRTLLLASAVVVALATAYAITSLRAKADGARITQTTLADIRARSQRGERPRVGGPGHRRGRCRDSASTTRDHQQSCGATSAPLARVDPDDASDQWTAARAAAGDTSQRWMTCSAQIARGDLERAEEIDERRVDPAFDASERGSWRRPTAREGAEAVGIFKWTAFWTYLSLCAAVLALMALFWRFRRIEQKRSREYSVRLGARGDPRSPHRPAQPPPADGRPRPPGRAPAAACSSTSTASRRTTTPTATSRATSCSSA